jgi:hypothetical protein
MGAFSASTIMFLAAFPNAANGLNNGTPYISEDWKMSAKVTCELD